MEVYPTRVKGLGWCHPWEAMYGMVKGVTSMSFLPVWMLARATSDKVQSCKCVGVWQVMCKCVGVGKVMCQCVGVWKVMC